MAKPWAEVESNQAYQALADNEKLAAKTQYFNDVVSVKPEYQSLPEESKGLAKNQFFGNARTAETPSKKISPMERIWPTAPLVKAGADILFNKAPAGIREGMRAGAAGGLDNENVLTDMAKGFKKGYENPAASESLQNQGNRATQDAIDETPIIGDMVKSLPAKEFDIPLLNHIKTLDIDKINPQSLQSLVRAGLGIPASTVGVAADIATNPGQLGLMAATDGAIKTIAPTKAGQAIGKVINADLSKPIANAAKKIFSPAKSSISVYKQATGKLDPSELDAFITESINKGVRPSVVGKSTPALTERFNNQSRDAVKTILENKKSLDIKNEFGESTGKLPQNLNEFSQAIDQTKKNIFDQYDKLSKAAGDAGAAVDLGSIADSIERDVTNKAVQTLYPELSASTKELADRLRQSGSFTPEEAQHAIEMLNNSLKAFYKNPNPQAAASAVVDASIATKLRNGLDNAVGLISDNYQGLKNKYGSLRAIQDDVIKRAIVDARKNYKGVFDLTDVFSVGDIAKGLMELNPGGVAKGAIQRSLISLYKNLNNPNQVIKRMFSVAERAYKPTILATEASADDALLQLAGPEAQKLLPFPKGRGNFAGSNSGPTINSGGPKARIQIPEILESDRARMSQEYGLKSGEKPFNASERTIKPQGKLKDNTELAKKIEAILQRRARNFSGSKQ